MIFFDKTRTIGQDANGKNVVWVSVFVDTAANLPAYNDYQSDGFILCMASEGRCIDTGDLYRLDSAGTWQISQAGTGTYTKAEIDALLNAKQTEMNEVANAGAKNYCPKETETSTGSGFTADVEVNIPAGTYILSFTGTLAYTASFNLYRALPHSGNSLASINLAATTGAQSAEFTITEAAKYITFYHNGSGNRMTNIMIRPAAITDPTFQPYAKTNRELTVMTDEDRAALVELVDSGAKNLFDMSGAQTFDVTGYGVHCTINKLTGVITLDGVNQDKKCTGSFNIKIADSTALELQSGVVYKLNCDGYTTSDTTIGIYVYTSDATPETQFDTYSHTELAWNTAWEQSNGFRLFIRSGTVVNNITLRPMLCTKAEWGISHAFQPYAPTNRELYEMILALQ